MEFDDYIQRIDNKTTKKSFLRQLSIIPFLLTFLLSGIYRSCNVESIH